MSNDIFKGMIMVENILTRNEPKYKKCVESDFEDEDFQDFLLMKYYSIYFVVNQYQNFHVPFFFFVK